MKLALAILAVLAIFMVAGSFLSSDLFTSSYLFAVLCVLLLISLSLCCIKRIISVFHNVKNTDKKSIRAWVSYCGSPVMHIGILLIIVGMFMSPFTGFSDTIKLTAGQTYAEDSAGFEVKLDSFEIIYGENYQISDYISTVRVIKDGREVLETEVAVNKPLVYKGVKFYQSTYGWAAKVKITEASGGEVLLDSVLKMPVFSSGIGDVSYSMYDKETGKTITQRFMVIPDQASKGTVNNLSPLPNNPALYFILYSNSEIAIIKDVVLGENEDAGGLIVSFEGLEYYTGLEVSSKPELLVVFVGSLIFIAGLIIVFYVRKGVNANQEVEDIGG
jgi:cytochrome c biogenesis protein